jgi:taurine dioxygenase
VDIEFRPLSHGIGAEVIGAGLVDVTRSNSAFDAVHEAFLKYCILLFRGQKITPEQHIEFSRRFGKLDMHDDLADKRRPDHHEILIVTNEKQADGKPSPTAYTGRHWHSDLSFTVQPALGSVLHGVRLPPVGGDTMFANQYMAYDALSDGMKKMLESLHAVQFHGAQHAERKLKSGSWVAQPIVRTHPETGRKALYVNEKCVTIDGMTEAESAPIIKYLCQHATQPEFVYRHQWRTDDVIMWDNRSAMHMALGDFDQNYGRYMERTTIIGTPSGYYVNN